VGIPQKGIAGSNPALSAIFKGFGSTPIKLLSKRARVRAPNGKSRKALANKEQSPLKGWEYPAGSSIRIREVINRYEGADFGVSYRVSIPAKLAGNRILKQFADAEKAEEWAQAQYKGLRKKGSGHFEAFSVKQREDALQAFELLADTGLSLTEAVRIAKGYYKPAQINKVVSDAVAEMLKEKEAENLRPRSIRDLKSRLRIFETSFGDRAIHEVLTPELQTWLDDLKGLSDKSVDGLSPRSKKNFLVTLKTFFNFAIDKGYRAKDDNPANGMIIPKIDWKVPSVLSVEETKSLMHTARTFHGGAFLQIVTLGLFAGIRSNELQMLDWSAIDLEEGTVTIGAEIAKKRRLRLIELSDNAIAWLKIAPNKTGKLTFNKAGVLFAELVRKAGFENWREEKSNAMRHSFGTYHFALHQNSALTAAALGHQANDQVLFDSYRSLARKKDGEAYFSIMPPND